MRRPLPPRLRDRALLALGAAAGLAGTWISLRIASGARIRGEPQTMFDLTVWWWAAFAVGAACLLRAPRRGALVVVLALAVAMRVVALAGEPAFSNDVVRYAWDGRVQAAGVDPYRYPPAAPELASLRDDWLWPDGYRCAEIGQAAPCTRITRSDVRTIYPPVAQAWFLAVHAASGGRGEARPWQVAALLVDLATLAALLALLRAWRRDPRWLVLYAWSPIAVLETAQNGHVDGLAVLLVLGALAALRRRPGLAGALVGAAAMVKLYPLVLAPLLVARRSWRGLAALAAVAAVAYLPHVLAVGPQVLGYLPGYLREEGYEGGGRFLLLDLLGLGGMLAQAAAVAVLAAVAGLVAWRGRDAAAPDVPARWLLGALLLVATPVQPWYALSLAAVAALGGAWWWLAVVAAGYPYFFRVIVGVPAESDAIGPLAYGLALLVVVAAGLLGARRRAGTAVAPEPAG